MASDGPLLTFIKLMIGSYRPRASTWCD